jgi:hypothetical protein
MLLLSRLFSLFGDFWSLFLGISWRSFGGNSLRVVGVTHKDHLRLFLVTLPLQTHGKLCVLVVFGGAQVLEVEPRDLRFPMIESISVEFL